MSARTLLLVFLAVICGASAVVVAYQLRSIEPTDATVPVLTAKADVMRGAVLDANLVAVSRYDARIVPTGALSSLDDLGGRVVLFPLSKGEPIVQSRLTSKDSGRGLAAMIPDGMRAFTIQTPHAAAGVGGFVQPGDKVDVLLTTTPTAQDDNTGGGVTTTLLQNVQVLAVAQRLDTGGNPAGKEAKVDPDIKSVTLLVSPDQAAKLDLGMNKGILHLALRNPKDDREAKARPATMAQLRFDQQKPLDLNGLLGRFASAAGQSLGAVMPQAAATREAQKPALPGTQQPCAQIWQLRGSRFDRPVDLYH